MSTTTRSNRDDDPRNRFQRDHHADFLRIARNVARRRPGPSSSSDDVYAVVALEADRLWTRFGGALPEDWLGRLHNASKAAWRDQAEGPAGNGLGGISGMNRRRRGLLTATAELRQMYGREPTADEILDHYNASAAATRADARKQGAIANVADLTPMQVSTTGNGEMTGIRASTDVESVVVETMSVRETIAAVSARLGADPACDPRLISFAVAWLTQIAGGYLAPRAELAAAWGVSEPTLGRWTIKVRQAAINVYLGGGPAAAAA